MYLINAPGCLVHQSCLLVGEYPSVSSPKEPRPLACFFLHYGRRRQGSVPQLPALLRPRSVLRGVCKDGCAQDIAFEGRERRRLNYNRPLWTGKDSLAQKGREKLVDVWEAEGEFHECTGITDRTVRLMRVNKTPR